MRDWWLRTLLVLQRPRPVFVALRDESPESVGDRAEPVLLIVLLGGIAGVLATHTAAHLMDDGSYDGLLVVVWAFVAGSLYGAFVYFVLGAFLHGAVKLLGSQGSYRRSRHVLAFAAAPIALSLIVWPVRLAVYGDDVFRSGGSDSSSGGHVFAALVLVFVAWSVVLLAIGVRSVHGWTWGRALAACGLAVALPAAIVVVLSVL